MHSESKTSRSLARALIGVVLCAACSSPTLAANWSNSVPGPAYQLNGGTPQAQNLTEPLKVLGTDIEGNVAEVGNRSGKYDFYKYESFSFDHCWVAWRETHERHDGLVVMSKEVEELRVPLVSLSRRAVRLDKIGGSAYLVSFTTIKLKTAMASHVRSTDAEGNGDEYRSIKSGSGIYFQNRAKAERVSKALVLSIGFCQKAPS